MSRINRIRIVNLSYNNNTTRIEDELFDLVNQSTLFSLRNGGGKSVFVQMITALFVDGKKRNTDKRPFAGYFTKKEPTFILVEWALDNDAGYVLTGMMVRKNQELKADENPRELDMVNFIYEYYEENELDIKHLPIIEQHENGMHLIGFSAFKKQMELWNRDFKTRFNYYDMNTKNRAYFKKLNEFRIYPNEWETIIKKINLKESGLSELFEQAKDEKTLVEEWFLKAVSKKLNKDKNRKAGFEELLNSYVTQYKENQGNILRRAAIENFQEEIQGLLQLEQELKLNEENLNEHEANLAGLLASLKTLIQETTVQETEVSEQLIELNEQIDEVAFEQHSLNIYELEDQILEAKKEHDVESQHLKDLKAALEQTQKESHGLEAAKKYQKYQRSYQIYEEYLGKLEIAKKKHDELLPEKNNLGYNLRLYYEQEVKGCQEALDQKQHLIEQLKEQKASQQLELNEKQNQVTEFNREFGQLQGNLKTFDSLIKEYNHQFKTNLSWPYESEFLNKPLSDLKAELVQNQKDQKQNINLKKVLEEQIIASDLVIRDTETAKFKCSSELEKAEEEQKNLEQQKAFRRESLRYIDWPQEKLYDQEGILQAFEQKITQKNTQIRQLERKQEQFQEEYEQIQSGPKVEISQEFQQLLDEEGIQIRTGSTWLKRNRQTLEQKQQLIQDNPFIPYSLILTKAELNRLQQRKLSASVSPPLPLLIQEELDCQLTMSNGFIQYDHLHFYVVYDGRLLMERQLQKRLAEQQLKLNKQIQIIKLQKQDLALYQEKAFKLQNQTLSVSSNQENQRQLKDLSHQLTELANKIATISQQKTEAQTQLKVLIENQTKLEATYTQKDYQYQRLMSLQERHSTYLRDGEAVQRLDKHLKELKQKIIELHENQTTLEERLKQEETQSYHLINQLAQYQKEALPYESYEQGTPIAKSLNYLQAQFQAITQKMGGQVQQLEAILEDVTSTYKEDEKELNQFLKRNQLQERDYSQLHYDEALETEILQKIEQYGQKIATQQDGIHELDTKIHVMEYQQEQNLGSLKSRFKTDQPLSRQEIKKRNYDQQLAELKQEQLLKQQKVKDLKTKIHMLERHESSLITYAHYPLVETWEFDNSVRNYEDRDWKQIKTQLITDYLTEKKKTEKLNYEISTEGDRLLRNGDFQDDWIKSPLKNLYELRFNPTEFLESYKVFDMTFTALLNRLAIDLANVEKEKAELVKQLLEYVETIHDNLGKIDKNSSIQVRGKTRKMLRIQLPNWEESKLLYQQKMESFVQNLTEECLKLLETNEPITTLLKSRLTTQHLYNMIVGTGKVGIKLYKVEESRESLITWEQATKNSGGENFLSAFIILSSLLSFMRRDDSQIFTNSEEGKVLLMDNPFAQTNAAHLLKPLMDLAKKTNTQLICLTGLRGESIYSRFENIYALNLIPSNTQKEQNRLKGNHIKEKANQQVIAPARIKEEQLSLLF